MNDQLVERASLHSFNNTLARQCVILRDSLASTGDLLAEARRCVRWLCVLSAALFVVAVVGWFR